MVSLHQVFPFLRLILNTALRGISARHTYHYTDFFLKLFYGFFYRFKSLLQRFFNAYSVNLSDMASFILSCWMSFVTHYISLDTYDTCVILIFQLNKIPIDLQSPSKFIFLHAVFFRAFHPFYSCLLLYVIISLPLLPLSLCLH